MANKGKISRRSFLTRVAGVSVTSGSFGLVTGCASTRLPASAPLPSAPRLSGLTDSDGGQSADPAGNGRGVAGREYTGELVTDKDAGPNADLPGQGRDIAPNGPGLVDRDYGAHQDPVGCGRGQLRYTAVTDTDAGETADRANWGRGFNLGEPDKLGTNSPSKCRRHSTRITDTDEGPQADPAGQGRGPT